LNPFHTIKSYFSNIHFNIIFPHMPVSFKWFLPLRFSDQKVIRKSWDYHSGDVYKSRSSETLVSYHNTAWHYNPKDFNLKNVVCSFHFFHVCCMFCP
jgi:hypothetical protein